VAPFVLGALLAMLLVVPAQAQVQVNIGIQLPGPPPLVVVPGMPVYYAAHAPTNVFFYSNHYWVFAQGGWYVGPTWNGPWVVVAPGRVPVPLLQVPVRYYPAPPPPWRRVRRDAPPPWEATYGRDWNEDAQERGWREREEHWDKHGRKGCPPGLAKQGRC